ncbi:hypothetical protein E1265_21360 [Streptomyces sp. 8K308]|uniref:hypothetical protein n=1 Tax=Streptomyces sp. 8K308 TaxID=2530388 RepID=UPI001053B18A|nr:hypothetical protein [Streptomyces sp. 8K308]TDC20621.1 hypothetical protein E1265_21360 [Streptomyces sp. 8K308]
MAQAFKPEISIGFGLATATLVYGVYQHALPPITDIRVADQQDHDVEAAERSAAWISAGVVAGVSLLTRDATVFVLGAGMVVLMAWWHRHADQVDPVSGLASMVNLPTRVEATGDTTYEAREAI